MRLRCLLGFHDYYATYTPLILDKEIPQNMVALFRDKFQYITMRRVCVFCKKKEEFIVQISGKLQDWDVLLSAPNFVSEEFKTGDR